MREVVLQTIMDCISRASSDDALQLGDPYLAGGMVGPISHQMSSNLLAEVGAASCVFNDPVALEEGIAGKAIEEIKQALPLPL